jgi:hypothetical protein
MCAQPRYFRDAAGTPSANAVGLNSGVQSTLLVVQGIQERQQLSAVIAVRVVDPLQAFRAVASIGT